MRTLISGVVIIFLVSGCSTLQNVVEAREDGKGTVEVYDVNMDDAWMLAKKSLRWGGSEAIEEYKEEGYMLTSKGMNLVTSGCVMGAWIEESGDNQTKVTVISKRRISTDITTGMTEDKFHRLFAKGSEILKSGEELPLSTPKLN